MLCYDKSNMNVFGSVFNRVYTHTWFHTVFKRVYTCILFKHIRAKLGSLGQVKHFGQVSYGNILVAGQVSTYAISTPLCKS